MLTIDQPARILKTSPRRGNHGGTIWLFFRAFGNRILVAVGEVKTMSAGSSPHIGKNGVKAFVIPATRTPVVEVDTEATAAYVRFSRATVARTMPLPGKDSLAMIDLDQKGGVIGIEFIGQKDFSIRQLLRDFPVRVPAAALNRTRYVTADLQTA